jgi:hypothetical protein
MLLKEGPKFERIPGSFLNDLFKNVPLRILGILSSRDSKGQTNFMGKKELQFQRIDIRAFRERENGGGEYAVILWQCERRKEKVFI